MLRFENIVKIFIKTRPIIPEHTEIKNYHKSL